MKRWMLCAAALVLAIAAGAETRVLKVAFVDDQALLVENAAWCEYVPDADAFVLVKKSYEVMTPLP